MNPVNSGTDVLMISPEILKAIKSKGAVYAAGIELLIQRGEVVVEAEGGGLNARN
ncbi:MAG: hypothetical protein Q4Q04_05225 [Methanocorpusculum sp.]|nr:hypothetical protein [Methanocorpusculum sp.]